MRKTFLKFIRKSCTSNQPYHVAKRTRNFLEFFLVTRSQCSLFAGNMDTIEFTQISSAFNIQPLDHTSHKYHAEVY